MTQEITETQSKSAIVLKMKDYGQLLKLRLASLVVFSAVVTYFMAAQNPSWIQALLLTLGGFLVTGSSNAFNQIIEKELDKKMERTQQRPLPQDRLTETEALIFSGVIGLLGIGILWYFMNPLSGILGIAALVSYVAVYTPLKRVTPFAVFVGAFPGAIPPMLGWVAATGVMSVEAIVVFLIQFMWQFPHFWALAWMLDDDYKKAGFQMLPSVTGRSKTSAFQVMVYTAGLIPIGLLPYFFQMAGPISAVITTICGTYFMIKAIKLHQTLEISDARKLLYASFVYLPIVQLALLLDKI
ncbi:MAG: heme o synthase [Bacteroidia bacterium]